MFYRDLVTKPTTPEYISGDWFMIRSGAELVLREKKTF